MEYFIGAAVSLIVQFIKNKYGTNTNGTLLAVLVLSFVSAGLYVLLVNTNIWTSLLQTLTVAGAFYAFIIQRFETK